MKVCEWGEFKAGVKRCRKAARVVVGYRQLFGHRIGPHGEEAVYQTIPTFRCADHAEKDIPGPIEGCLALTVYTERLAAAQGR